MHNFIYFLSFGKESEERGETMKNEVFNLQDSVAYPTVYSGPLHQFRPFVKWILILYLIVFVGISCLILHEESLREVIEQSAVLVIICLAWLIPTRTRSALGPADLTLTFDTDAAIFDYPAKPSVSRKTHKAVLRRECYTMRYDEITDIRFNRKYHRLEVLGDCFSQIYDLDESGRPIEPPCFSRHQTNSGSPLWAKYLSDDVMAQVMDAFTAHTGKEIQAYGESGPKL